MTTKYILGNKTLQSTLYIYCCHCHYRYKASHDEIIAHILAISMATVRKKNVTKALPHLGTSKGDNSKQL